MTTERPSLAEFERRVAARDQRGALAAAFAILHLINLRYGRVDRVEIDGVRGKPAGEVAEIFATRFAAALGTLLTDPDFRFAPGEYPRLAVFHRWIDLIFGVSGFRSSDHLFELLGKRGGEGGLTFAQESLTRVLAMRSLGSRFGLNLEELWRTNTGAAAVAFLHYLGSRWLFNGAAHAFREKLLEWLPARLDKVEIRDSTLGRIVETCMLCSYATTPKKHEIKSVLLRQLRRACLAAGVAETPPAPPPAPGSRPTVVVVCEHFSLGHSMFRTHSLAVRSLRERFHVIGVMFQYQIGPEVLELFDEMIPLEQTGLFEQVKAVAGEIARRSPALIFFPSVGMMPHAVALATLRLAPVQCASYGHAASTMSPAMDHIILPEDFVGARGRFSENVVALPARAMPFVRRRPKSPIPAPSPESARSGIVRVAVPAAIMKLNPRLFAALARIAKEAKTPVEFHFYPLGAQGLVSVALSEAYTSKCCGCSMPQGSGAVRRL